MAVYQDFLDGEEPRERADFIAYFERESQRKPPSSHDIDLATRSNQVSYAVLHAAPFEQRLLRETVIAVTH